MGPVGSGRPPPGSSEIAKPGPSVPSGRTANLREPVSGVTNPASMGASAPGSSTQVLRRNDAARQMRVPGHDDFGRRIGGLPGLERRQTQPHEGIALLQLDHLPVCGQELRFQSQDLLRLAEPEHHQAGREGVGNPR